MHHRISLLLCKRLSICTCSQTPHLQPTAPKKRDYFGSPLTSAIIPFTLMISNLFAKAIRPASFVRCFASAAYVLPPLPYARNALAPAISEETMKCHYDGHHQT